MAQRPSVIDYVNNLKSEASRLFAGISELAKAEIGPSAKHAGIGGGMLGATAVLGIGMLWLLLFTVGLWLSVLFSKIFDLGVLVSLGWGFTTMLVVAILLVVVFGLIGLAQVKKVKMPEATIAETKASLAALTDSITAGVADARQGVRNPKGVGLASAVVAEEPLESAKRAADAV